MALFQTSVLNKYLSEQDKELVLQQYSIFKEYFLNSTIQENIIASKEEEFQEGFLRELFVKVLGYTINPEPNFNLITELKNEKDSKKADGAIKDGANILAVIELKSTKTTDFNKIEIQAFGYKNNQANCRYVITSNFQKIRFYIDNAIEFLEWDLFKLDLENFKLMFLCLHKDAIFKNIPAAIKTESVTVEDNVTKKLYKEYSQFRKSLFNNIVELNPSIDKLLVFKKTQKLLDRFLFLFFAEDRMLVPPNSVRTILDQWNNLKDMDAYQPLYDRFKLYFGYLNTGHKGKLHDIFAYNGGLFAPDEILDTITMDDSILYDATLSLSNYDYNSEVDVNILGHIFEHSLTEIEELEKEITNTEIVENKTTKRKKDGVFYTPKYITKYIVENTVGTLCKNKKEELKLQEEDYHKLTKKAKKQLYDTLMQYKDWLLHVTIIDPACGSGAFLNQALEFLIAEHKWISELEANITNSSIVFDIETTILENNIFGVDINEESVEIAKLSLWLRTARKERKLNSLNNNIKCGNSLIDDVNVAGLKSFNWKENFPKIIDNGGFDIVIGNPPYATKIFSSNEKLYFNSNYSVAQYQLDLYLLFIQKGVDILKLNGIIGFITPNSWLKNMMMSDCRKFLLENIYFQSIIPNLPNVFADASVDSLIFIGIKQIDNIGTTNILEIANNEIIFKHNIDQKEFLKNERFVFAVEANIGILEILNKLNAQSEKLEKYFEISRGINPYDSYRGQSKEIILSKAYHSDYKKDETFVPEIRGKHLDRYFYKWDGKHYISYGNWLAAPREKKFFAGERIVFRQVLSERLICTVIEEDMKIDQSIFIAVPNTEIIKAKYVICLLASKLGALYFKYSSNEFDELFPKIKLGEFKNLPLKLISLDSQKIFIERAENISSKIQNLYLLSNQFQKLLTSKFETLNINTKLEKWYTLSFAEFSKELTKQKIKLSLSEQSEWLTFFEEEKQKALAIKNEIDKTDKEIDNMVYALYGLTDEEIKIVEGE
jgi:type I restriction-modification system DNA methylase subunit